MKPQALSALAGSLAAILISSTALAEDRVNVQPKQVGDVQFITGGIGDEERTAIEAVKNNYNLHVMSAGSDGAFTGRTHLTILDNQNKKVLETDMGPLFYAQLPPGTYTVEGTYDNKTRSQKVNVAQGNDNVHFTWK